ncbi:MAG: phosphoribosylformylglycinamidine synthase [Bacteroidia bacterium]|jgi:hypothetical protein|nr:phosphoribosylformylglycinamidine synthase [Bacteroidia bacterium]
MKKVISLFILFCPIWVMAQIEEELEEVDKAYLDSIYIGETENIKGIDKVFHAEPLFIDLIRDLGARKGEREWNIGMGMVDKNRFDEYNALIEYEWAPINRLGLEVELPFSFYYPLDKTFAKDSIPLSRLNSLKLAAQYSFFVSEKYRTSMALGYIHEFELVAFNRYGKTSPFNGQLFNPFIVVAKRWGDNYHSLIYTGPRVHKHHEHAHKTQFQMNTNFHYMITGTRNFIGVEVNKQFTHQSVDMVIRPQMRVGVADNIMVGIVSGIPVKRNSERISSFIRLIYEPKHHKK